MVRDNQITIYNGEYVCEACDREFTTEHGLFQHCRNARVHEGEWCERCEWLFVSPQAKLSHVQASLSHWVCSLCGVDEYEEDDLTTHQVNYHYYCRDCNCNFNSYRAHRIAYHNRCQKCDREFGSSNELVMVSGIREWRTGALQLIMSSTGKSTFLVTLNAMAATECSRPLQP